MKYEASNKITYHQPYNPTTTNEEKQLFIIVIQEEWMVKHVQDNSLELIWAIDSTFKTN